MTTGTSPKLLAANSMNVEVAPACPAMPTVLSVVCCLSASPPLHAAGLLPVACCRSPPGGVLPVCSSAPRPNSVIGWIAREGLHSRMGRCKCKMSSHADACSLGPARQMPAACLPACLPLCLPSLLACLSACPPDACCLPACLPTSVSARPPASLPVRPAACVSYVVPLCIYAWCRCVCHAWRLCVSSMVPVCVMHGACVCHTWCLYVSCMVPLCVCHAWCLCVCVMHGACVCHAWCHTGLSACAWAGMARAW